LFSSDSLSQWLVRWNLRSADPESSLGLMVVRNPALAAMLKASFPLTTLLELSAPLALLYPRYRRIFVPAMLLVHLGIYFLMHINFWELALLYVVFCGLPILVAANSARRYPRPRLQQRSRPCSRTAVRVAQGARFALDFAIHAVPDSSDGIDAIRPTSFVVAKHIRQPFAT
jgi:hypothetical protein